MKQALPIYTAFLATALTFLLFVSFNSKYEGEQPSTLQPINPSTHDGPLPQIIKPIDLDKVYAFAGEAIPTQSFDALERLDRELSVNSYWHSSTLLNIKKANRYFPVIEPILAEHGVPDDFKYLAVAESNLRNVVSPAGAKGVWQFVKNTGAHYGLEINSEVDERYHIEKATHAACKYLKDYHRQFGKWTLAAAAYNMGGPRLKRLMGEQKAQSYYDLNVNQETSRYVFRIMAIKEILSDPAAFGFYLDQEDLYKPLHYTTVTVDGPVSNWGEFAQKYGTSYRILKVYNPWLVDSDLTNVKGKRYTVKVP